MSDKSAKPVDTKTEGLIEKVKESMGDMWDAAVHKAEELKDAAVEKYEELKSGPTKDNKAEEMPAHPEPGVKHKVLKKTTAKATVPAKPKKDELVSEAVNTKTPAAKKSTATKKKAN